MSAIMGFNTMVNATQNFSMKLIKSALQPSVSLWFVLRGVSLVVAFVAFYFRHGPKEFQTATSPRNLLLSPWYFWDVHYYVEIVRNGYQPGAPTANFHPLYPWISTLVAAIIREPLLSLLLVSSVAGLLLTIAFYRLARLDLDDHQAWQATALLLVWPVSVTLFLPYTEPLFLLLSVYCLFTARQKRFWLAGLAGALATLTRQQGLFLVLPVAWEVWEASGRNWRCSVKRSSPLILAPAAYVFWIIYRALAVSDVHPDFSSLQRFIHTVMISPSSYEITDQHAFLPPWVTVWRTINVFWRGGVASAAYTDMALAVAFMALLILSWNCLCTSYRIYSVAIVLVSLSFYAGDIDPFLALPRHLLLAFPVFIGLAARYRFRTFPVLLVALSICQIGLLSCFVWQSWVP